MPEVTRVEEFKQEGFAIVEDTAGRFIINKHSPDMIPLDDKKTSVPVAPEYPIRKTCALLTNWERQAMLT